MQDPHPRLQYPRSSYVTLGTVAADQVRPLPTALLKLGYSLTFRRDTKMTWIDEPIWFPKAIFRTVLQGQSASGVPPKSTFLYLGCKALDRARSAFESLSVAALYSVA